MKVSYYCDNCRSFINQTEIEEVNLYSFMNGSLTQEKWKDIINYNDQDGLLLYSLCVSCVNKIGAPPEE